MAELDPYNITIVSQTKDEFFWTNELADPIEPSMLGFMTSESRETAADKKTKKLLHHFDLTINPKASLEMTVINFAAELWRGFKYGDNDRIDFIRYSFPFLICGENPTADTDVGVVGDDEILLLLLQEDQRLTNMKDPEPQVMVRRLNHQPRDAMTFPALTMMGTTPIFYKVTVTEVTVTAALSKNGTYPEIETRFFLVYTSSPLQKQRRDGPPSEQTRNLAMY